MSQMLTALRSATQAAHARLESASLGHKIMDGSLTESEYRRLLRWQQQAHELLEPLVSSFSAGDYHYRVRFPGPESDHPAAPSVDRATAIGILYVLEGASLGGSIIHRKLQAIPELHSLAPFTFYHDQAAWGLQQWKSFVGFLKKSSFTEEEIGRASASAVHTFGEFSRLWQEGSGR